MNSWFRISGEKEHKLVCDLVLMRSRQSVDILKPEAVWCQGQDMMFMRKNMQTENIYDFKATKPHGIWTKNVFIPEPLSVLINTWACVVHDACAHKQSTETSGENTEDTSRSELFVSGLVPL